MSAINTPAPGPSLLNLALLKTAPLPFAELVKRSATELVGAVKEWSGRDAELRKQVKTAQGERKSAPVLAVGKTLAAAATVYEKTVSGGNTESFAAWAAREIGVSLDKLGRPQQASRVYQRLVVSGMLPEDDYDSISAEAVEYASVIIGCLDERKEPLTGNNGLDTVNLLRKRADGYEQKLREIRNVLKGKVTASANGAGAALDAKGISELFRRLLPAEPTTGVFGHGLAVAELVDFIKTGVPRMPKEQAKSLYFATQALTDAFMDHHEALVTEFEAEHMAKNAPVNIAPVPAPSPAQPAADEFATHRAWIAQFMPNLGAELVDDTINYLIDYVTDHGALPKSKADFVAFVAECEQEPAPATA